MKVWNLNEFTCNPLFSGRLRLKKLESKQHKGGGRAYVIFFSHILLIFKFPTSCVMADYYHTWVHCIRMEFLYTLYHFGSCVVAWPKWWKGIRSSMSPPPNIWFPVSRLRRTTHKQCASKSQPRPIWPSCSMLWVLGWYGGRTSKPSTHFLIIQTASSVFATVPLPIENEGKVSRHISRSWRTPPGYWAWHSSMLANDKRGFVKRPATCTETYWHSQNSMYSILGLTQFPISAPLATAVTFLPRVGWLASPLPPT